MYLLSNHPLRASAESNITGGARTGDSLLRDGIRFVLILDENFGNLPEHAEAVIDLLARYQVHWLVQSRVDLFLRNFNDWKARGMEGALFGIESFHQEVRKQIRKGEKAESSRELARRLNGEGLYAHGYYIIGFPTETEDSIREDLQALASLELTSHK